MAGWLAGRVMDKFFDTCYDYLLNQFTSNTDMKDKLERLRLSYPKIIAIFSAARRAQIIDQDPDFNRWIWQLRDAIDEADDLLDDFEYFKHEEYRDKNKEQNKVRSYLNNISNAAKRLCVGNEDPLKSKPDLKRLEEIVQKLDIIFAGASHFLHLLDFVKQEQREQQLELHKIRETGCVPTNDLIGRGKEKDFIIEWLRKPSNEQPQTHATTTSWYHNISLLSIVGIGGMGKTTLLQHVYEDEITKEFELKMWVCVSDNFDVKNVIADMLESVHDNRSLSALQNSLKSKVMLKKFLLVLDDIWDDKEEEAVLIGKWGNVLVPLAQGGLGSKILITTRTDSAASMIAKVIRKRKEALRLEGLKEDECLQLLITHAFAVGENPDDHENLKPFIGELAKKIYGSPLAAKVMGGVLNSSLDERHWRNVLNSSLGLDGIFPILKLSYIFLPKHLQSCFSFCSIFEQDHIFDKDDLIRMWIALGFIQPYDNNTLEDIGERYFVFLMKKSFFEEVFFSDGSGSSRGYKMHDLLHELAQSVSKRECLRFVGDEKLLLDIPETIRHLSIEINHPKELEKVGRFKHLQTLRISGTYVYDYDSNLVDALIEIFQVTRSIRLLHLDYPLKLKMVPEEIRYLRHLRYFRIYGLELLPRSLSILYHLQFIISNKIFGYHCSYDYYPRSMTNLSNLRYLSGDHGSRFPWIGKGKFLPQLEFCIKNENGYRIEELEHMIELRILKIISLENVMDAEEAANAKLCDKRKLTDLFLKWNHSKHEIADRDLDERVLDNLQPHIYLKKLLISNYMGARSAIWMNEAHLINNLESITLDNCVEWEILPPFGQLPFLKTLELRNMPKVKRLENKLHGDDMCSVFPELEELILEDLEALVDWFDASTVDDLFPRLTTLCLSHCPNLQELPYLPPKLESLFIDNIGWKTLNCCSISKSIPLKILDVRYCENITSISPCAFPSLKTLYLVGLEVLVGWFDVSVVDDFFPCLTEVRLFNCPNLQELPYLPPKLETLKMIKIGWKTLNCCKISKSIPLETLYVINCENITSISPCVFPSLKTLNLENLEELVDWFDASIVDGLFPCLTKLCLSDCPNLQELPYLPPKLESLELKKIGWKTLNCCSVSKSIPLKILDVSYCPNITSISPCVFPSLETLFLSNLEALVDWFDASVVVDDLFPCLTEVRLSNCPNLQELPYLPPKLETLNIIKIGWKTLNCCRISKSIPLETLVVYNCENITSISPCVFPSLKTLHFEYLEELVDWFDASIVDGLFPCLTELCLSDCPNLQELPYLPPKLESLEIYKIGWKTLNCCSISKSVPLKSLLVQNCPNITSISLEGEIGKLELLKIKDLPSLQSFPSSLANISSLKFLKLAKLPQLQEYPVLSPSFKDFHFN